MQARLFARWIEILDDDARAELNEIFPTFPRLFFVSFLLLFFYFFVKF